MLFGLLLMVVLVAADVGVADNTMISLGAVNGTVVYILSPPSIMF